MSYCHDREAAAKERRDVMTEDRAATVEEMMTTWRQVYDDMVDHCLPVKAQIQALQEELHDRESKFSGRLARMEHQIRQHVTAEGHTVKSDGVEARYRKGARRVTYKWQTVDTVLGVLRDVLPDTAKTLEGARKESIGNPSVNIVRVAD